MTIMCFLFGKFEVLMFTFMLVVCMELCHACACGSGVKVHCWFFFVLFCLRWEIIASKG